MTTAPELWRLLGQAEDLPHGAAQIAMAEQILRHADAAGDPRLAFNARLFGTTAYIYGGEPAKAFVTFSWCVSDFDRNPQPYHQRLQHNLLWQFKAMVTALVKFPEVPLARTYAVLDDMERRYRESGHGMQTVYKHRYLVANHVGLADEADAWFERWQATPRDSLSDCAGCDPTSVAAHLASRGRWADAVAHADPVLAGELTCTEQPQSILRELMVPYLQAGRPADAEAAHRRSYRLERGNLADLANIGDHIVFCARTGNEHRGLEILQRHVDWLDRAPSPAAAMSFAAAGGLLLRRLTEAGHGAVPIRRADRGDLPAAELAGELAGYATELALRFDARNGTDRQSRRVAERLAAEPFEATLTLSPTARRQPAAEPSGDRPAADVGPVPEVGPAELLELARRHYDEDRDEAMAATLDALDARFPDLDDPLLVARRAVLAGNRLLLAGREGASELWAEAVGLFSTAGATGEAGVVRARLALERAYDGEIDEDPIRADITYQEKHGDPAARAAAWMRLCIVHLLQGRADEAVEAGDRADACADETGDDRLIAFHALLRAQTRMNAGRPDEALPAARASWSFYREHGPARRRAEAAMLYGHLSDDPAEQVESFGAVIAHGEDGPVLAARVGRGRALMHLDRAGEAIPDLVEAVALCAERDLVEGGALARVDLANAYRLAGRPVEAAEVAEEAQLMFDRLGEQDQANDTRFLLAGLYREIGDKTGALDTYRDLIERLTDNLAGRGQIGEELGGLLYDLDRDAEAALAFRAAAADLHEAGQPIDELRVLRRQVGAWHYADEVEQAEEAVRLAAERFAALPAEIAAEPNAIWQQGMTAFEAGRLLTARDRHDEALPHLRGVPERLRAIGAGDDADRVEIMLAEALLRTGAAADAEALLAGLLDRLPADAPARRAVAGLHAEATKEAPPTS
jgi:tetratricopeptide (TPR) repeat protein